MQENEKNYAREWFEYGRAHKDDRVMHFMMMWLAFNWLYNQERHSSVITTETAAIRSYCERHQQILMNYYPYASPSISCFLIDPVQDAISGSPRNDLFGDLKDHTSTPLKRLQALLLTIYQVRCNLFHGSKSLHIQRDMELVKASGDILEGYLKEILEGNSVIW